MEGAARRQHPLSRRLGADPDDDGAVVARRRRGDRGDARRIDQHRTGGAVADRRLLRRLHCGAVARPGPARHLRHVGRGRGGRWVVGRHRRPAQGLAQRSRSAHHVAPDIRRLSVADLRVAQHLAARRSRQSDPAHQLRRADPLRHAAAELHPGRQPGRFRRRLGPRGGGDRRLCRRTHAARRPDRRPRPQSTRCPAIRGTPPAVDRRCARGFGMFRRRGRRRAVDRRGLRGPVVGRLLGELWLGWSARRPRRPQPRSRGDSDCVRVRRPAHRIEFPRRHRGRPADDRRRPGVARAGPADSAGSQSPRNFSRAARPQTVAVEPSLAGSSV